MKLYHSSYQFTDKISFHFLYGPPTDTAEINSKAQNPRKSFHRPTHRQCRSSECLLCSWAWCWSWGSRSKACPGCTRWHTPAHHSCPPSYLTKIIRVLKVHVRLLFIRLMLWSQESVNVRVLWVKDQPMKINCPMTVTETLSSYTPLFVLNSV